MLPGVGFAEMVLLVLVAIVVVGPKELPLMMRKFGRFTGKMRAMAFEFRQGIDELGRQAELDELRKEVQNLKKHTGIEDIQKELDEDAVNLEKDIQSAMADEQRPAPQPDAPATTTAAATTTPGEPEKQKQLPAPGDENSIGGGLPPVGAAPAALTAAALAEGQAVADTANGYFDDDFRLEGHGPVAETKKPEKQDAPA